MTLKRIVFLVYGALASMIVLGGMVFFTISSFSHNTHIIDGYREKSVKCGELELLISQSLMPPNDYRNTGDLKERDTFESYKRQIKGKINEMRKLDATPQEVQLLDAAEKDLAEISLLADKIFQVKNSMNNMNSMKSMMILSKELDEKGQKAISNVSRIHELIQLNSAKALEDIEAKERQSTIVIIVTVLAVMIIGIWIATNLKKYIITPLLILTSQAEIIAGGDLTTDIDIQARGEVKKLVDIFAKLVINLRQMVSNIAKAGSDLVVTSQTLSKSGTETHQISREISKAIEDVAQGASQQTYNIDQMYNVIKQFTVAVDQIAIGAQEQSINVSQTSANINQMASSIQEVAKSAQTVFQVAEKTSGVARDGGEAVSEAIIGMEEIKGKVFETSRFIKDLGEQSLQIGEIIQVIDDLVEQTNLLALNAAIEAARAGEHGKGFAVVAEEVRRLAERSGQATKEIAELIRNIQVGTAKAVKATEESAQEAEHGSGLAKNAGNALEQIMKMVDETYLQVQSISAAAEQVSASSTEVVTAIGNVSSITEENTASTEEISKGSKVVSESVNEMMKIAGDTAASAEQVTASTYQMKTSSQDIANSASELEKLSINLQNLIKEFKF